MVDLDDIVDKIGAEAVRLYEMSMGQLEAKYNHHSLLTTHYLLLTTYYSLLTTHYSLHTTHYLLLTTY